MTSKIFLSVFFAASLLIAGCSESTTNSTSNSAAKTATTPVSIDVISAGAKGFTVGSAMSARTVYVFFDAQCPHCSRLWEASTPLHRKVKFVWIPVGLINNSSTTQGAALLTAANPVALMTEHEKSLLSGGGGISASSSVASEITQAIKGNTKILNSFGAESVPFIVANNFKTGQLVRQEGAMSTDALATFLGLEFP